MTKIILTTHGEQVLVDDADYDYLSQFKWHLMKGYPARAKYLGGGHVGRVAHVMMHREILGCPQSHIDHANRNRLDNRRANLRLASSSENCRNKGMQKNNTSGYRGVTFHRGRWEAQIGMPGRKVKYLGSSQEASEAARMYDAAARIQFGEFAVLNFPEEGTR
jgi:hypothetical protein